MQPSPYTPGGISADVPGRDEQLTDINERISYVVDLHGFVDRIRVDTAPRGFGKTSMLARVQRMADDRRALTVWVVGGEDGTLMSSIAAEISVLTAGWSAAAVSTLRELIGRSEFKLGLGMPGVAHLETKIARGNAPTGAAAAAPAGAREFENLIRQTVAAALGEGHTGVILLIDEIQNSDRPGLSALAHGWQNLQRRGRDLPAAVFAVGLPDTAEVIRGAVTFSERFAYRPLSILSEPASVEALVRPAGRLGVSWEPAALGRAVAYAQGFPYSLQLLGDAAWRSAGRPDPGSVISVRDVAAAEALVEADLDTLYLARWNDATPAEQDFLQAMAALGDTSMARADIAERLGSTPRALSVPRDHLISKGIVRATARGRLGFTINGFAQWIRSRAATAAEGRPGPPLGG